MRGPRDPIWQQLAQPGHCPSMASDIELLTTAELFLATVVYCFEDAQQVLEEAVAASVEEHG